MVDFVFVIAATLAVLAIAGIVGTLFAIAMGLSQPRLPWRRPKPFPREQFLG